MINTWEEYTRHLDNYLMAQKLMAILLKYYGLEKLMEMTKSWAKSNEELAA
jgi:hypothetical protein